MLEENAFWNLGGLTAVTKARWTLVQTVKTWQVAFRVEKGTGSLTSVAYLKGKQALSGFCRDFGRLLHGACNQRPMQMPEGWTL